MSIQRFIWRNPNAEDLSGRLADHRIPYNFVNTVNWKGYPYCPIVGLRVAHTDKAILINYRVDEEDTKAVCTRDNGKVWEDSCVEFFISFNEGIYYNIECNCIGKIRIGRGSGKEQRILLPEALLKKVDRWSDLGNLPIKDRSGEWRISLVIPKEIFYPDVPKIFTQLKAKGNFYKCGDNLKTPHFVSWSPIKSETPNFHLPEFFGELEFE